MGFYLSTAALRREIGSKQGGSSKEILEKIRNATVDEKCTPLRSAAISRNQ
jgi:hypothetical protein